MSAADRFRLDGKVALVTGGGQGIGRVFALALAEAGAAVVVIDINDRTGSLVAEEARATGVAAVFIHADVTDERQVTEAVARTVSELGGLDIAVNNAWVGGRSGAFAGAPASALELPLEEWDFVHNLLLKACFVCCRAEALAMIPRGRGKIVNMASMSALIANASVAYGSAKAGVVNLTRGLAAEWGAYNINVNSISPSYTLSPARRRDPQASRDLIRSLHPMGWHQRPEDLVGTLLYLASGASDYVTGQNVLVDGGHTLNVWLNPPARHLPALVSPEEETQALLHDLSVLGISHDNHGVAPE